MHKKKELIFRKETETSEIMIDMDRINHIINHQFDYSYEEKIYEQLIYCFYKNKNNYSYDELNEYFQLFDNEYFYDWLKNSINEIKKLYILNLNDPESAEEFINNNLSKVYFARIDNDYMWNLEEKIINDINENIKDNLKINEIVNILNKITKNPYNIFDEELNNIFKNVLQQLKGKYQKKL